MATEAAKVEAAPAAEAPKKKSKKLLFGVIALVLVGGGVGGWMALKPKPGAADGADKAEKTKPPAAPIYFKYDPAFVVNFGGEGSARYLQVMVETMTRDPAVAEIIKNNEPAVRNDLVMLFSSQDNATLLSAEGKEKLRQSTLEAIRKVVASEGGDPKLVENVYFTSFVIQ
ncbi:MAG: flagellar basal body-associated FliL family protein [Steroidobacteraceae bacterium]